MVSCHSVKNGCLSELPYINPDVEEADARIILHAMHAVKSGTERIVVLYSDTDVFVLLMHYWQLLHSSGLLEL